MAVGFQCVSELQRLQKEFATSLEALSSTYDGIQAAIEGIPELLAAAKEASEDMAPSPGALGIVSPLNDNGINGINGEKEKFELSADGVPTMTKATKSQHTNKLKQKQESTAAMMSQREGLRLLDDWSESFVVSQEEAIVIYNNLFRIKDRLKNASGSPAGTSMQSVSNAFHMWLGKWHYFWQIFTLGLVFVDFLAVPINLAWADESRSSELMVAYFRVAPFLWGFDVIMSFVPGLLEKSIEKGFNRLKSYIFRRFFIDVGLVVLDFVLLNGLLNENFRAFSLIRLSRITKFKGVVGSWENRLAASGNMRFVLYLTIFQAIARVLAVNHVLACLLYYVGRIGDENGLPNWIVRYGVSDFTTIFKYMLCFNWVIAEYTPAPFPYQPQNEYEQAVIIVIILSCLPLLGAQIGKISGTLNLLTEKAKERDTVRRDLQRWLFKTNAPERLTTRMLDSLNDVLQSKDSPLDVKQPIALKFLPSTLLEELHIVKIRDKLSIHGLFKMLMNDRIGIAGPLATAFRTVNFVQGEDVFAHGKKAEGLIIIQSGEFLLHMPRADGSMANRGSRRAGWDAGSKMAQDTWLAELCLYSQMTHASYLTAQNYSKILFAPVPEFVNAVQGSPAAVVAVHEYATRLLNLYAKQKETMGWEIMSEDVTEVAVQHTQLSDLLEPGTGRMNQFKSTEELDFSGAVATLVRKELSNEDIIENIKEQFPELRESGIYSQLQFDDEADRAMLSMLSAVWILKDDYTSMVASQKKAETRLVERTFRSIQDFLGIKRMSQEQLTAALVILALRGLSKSEDFSKLCPPSERRTPEQVLNYAISHLDAFLPSMACLRGDAYDYLVSTARMLKEFNFAQLLQGENNPHSVWLLQCSLQEEGEKVFGIYLFVQVCMLCGVTGHVTLKGSMFLNELNGRSLLKGLACLQHVSDEEPQTVYWRYIASRAQALNLQVKTPSHLVLARLACLTRTVESDALQNLASDWETLTAAEKDALYEIFLTDGLYHKAFIFLYLPMFLTNAVANLDLGLRRGLQFLVELYNKLLMHRCLSAEVYTVKVDISSLAALAKEVDDVRLLRQCLDYSRIVQHAHGVTVLLTAESYQVLSGQLVNENRSADLLEMMMAQQRRIEEAVLQKGKGPRQAVLLRRASTQQSNNEQVVSDSF